MAIQSINNVTTNVAAQTKPVGKNPLESSKQGNPATDVDTVNISTADGIKKAVDASNSAPVVNESRVAEIKAAIQAGNYKIDPDHVAEKMMQLETKLANST
ncbi:flagellar biosynthesis anti-sigma factor FlgM [Methylomonas sp. SURF-2]|uniref:Negative regulator of flagellin synthesis n=1 Tax=Methylomonas subterranea TaxID=2952225 RepID=A0ABT1TBB8_9GAMM|nr:flagellar biosynthesis anti-sigma factor FlgM [Methylomonas sp. SURF-2]MCQ8102541.1 flagellar biosynthesis anti-sigma factor FlgM [Methylomonas sp. SURF-2]